MIRDELSEEFHELIKAVRKHLIDFPQEAEFLVAEVENAVAEERYPRIRHRPDGSVIDPYTGETTEIYAWMTLLETYRVTFTNGGMSATLVPHIGGPDPAHDPVFMSTASEAPVRPMFSGTRITIMDRIQE